MLKSHKNAKSTFSCVAEQRVLSWRMTWLWSRLFFFSIIIFSSVLGLTSDSGSHFSRLRDALNLSRKEPAAQNAGLAVWTELSSFYVFVWLCLHLRVTISLSVIKWFHFNFLIPLTSIWCFSHRFEQISFTNEKKKKKTIALHSQPHFVFSKAQNIGYCFFLSFSIVDA